MAGIGKGDRIRLLDFGMCLLLPRYHQREVLFPPTPPIERYETGEHERVIGTPGYTAPEVITGGGTSVRSDIYSVCAILYRMLRGQPLVDPSTSTSRSIRRGEFPGPLAPVADLLRRGTARDPGDRPRNMADLLAELEALRSTLRRASRRQTLIRVVVITALASTVAALSTAWMFSTAPTESPDTRVSAPLIIPVNQNASAIWASVFSPPENTCFLALLPGYLERQDSSLVCMVAHFIGRSAYRQSGFFLYDHAGLARQLEKNKMENVPTVLFGVSFALADFAENHSIAFPDLPIIEPGGMKGSKKELSREALQKLLSASFGVKKVYSEYGMTELLSQAYTAGGQYFQENAVLQVRSYQVSDPLTPEKAGKPGMLAVTDLVNIDSCAFLLSEDLGVRS